MLFPIYLIFIWTAALKSIAMRIISSIRSAYPHSPTRQITIDIPHRKSHDAWSTTTTPLSASEPSPSPFPTTLIPEFRPKSLEQPLPSLVGMASLDITQSQEGAALAPHRPAPEAPCTWPQSQPKASPLLANKPHDDPPNDRIPVELEGPAHPSPFFSSETGVCLSARKIVRGPGNDGSGRGAHAPMDVRRKLGFVDVPLTPPAHVGREEGAEAPMLMVFWRWICGWVLGWRRGRVVERRFDLEVGRRYS